MTENTHMKGILEVTKFEKGAQVEIISSSMNRKLSKMDKKILAQHRKDQRRMTMKPSSNNLKKTLSVPMDDLPQMNLLPTFDTKPRLDALESMMEEASDKNPKRRQQVAIMQA